MMNRRDFFRSSATAAALGVVGQGTTMLGENTTACPPPFPHVEGLTRYVAEFIVNTRYENIPGEVVELGKKDMLDGFGLALSGSVGETGPLVHKYLEQGGFQPGEATVAGTALKVAPRFAAFANGVAIHNDDFDDTQLAAAKDRVYGLLTHPTAPVLSAALAVAETKPVSGRNLMAAYHAGVEVECKIAEAISPRHYEDGFHSTGTIGTLGAAAAAARLRGFDLDQTLRTLGIAASEGAGLRENFGTMTKPFHAGHAAENGVFAADLAALGWTAAKQILEAPRGFFHAYGGTFEPSFIQNKLGNPWTFASPGVSIKPFPSGSLTHPGMTEMLRLIRTNDLKPEQVEKVDVGTNHNMPNALIHHHPTTGLQAKFSMEYCMAILLLYGNAGLGDYTDEAVNRPEAQAMLRQVNFYVDPEAERAGYDRMTTIIHIHLKDGKVLQGRADFAKGSPANPMTYDEVAAKFQGNAAFAKWPKQNADALVELVRALDSVHDVRRLLALWGKQA